MNQYIELKEILEKMIALLDKSNEINWKTSLIKLRDELEIYPADVPSKLIGSMGGMGSLNDLILYKEGKLLVQENEYFDRLREQLYKLCQSSRLLSDQDD